MGTQTVSAASSVVPGNIPAGQDVAIVSEAAFENVERVVGQIQRQLKALRAEHAAIAKKIWLIKNTIAGLAQVFGPEVVSPDLQGLLAPVAVRRRRSRGLTDACREALHESCAPLTLKQISGRIQEGHPTLLSHHRYPLPIIQIMLRRLVMYGEAEEVSGAPGLRSWKSSSGNAHDSIKGSVPREMREHARIF
jgi:hypothetical protein